MNKITSHVSRLIEPFCGVSDCHHFLQSWWKYDWQESSSIEPFWCVSEIRISKFSSTMVKVWLTEILQEFHKIEFQNILQKWLNWSKKIFKLHFCWHILYCWKLILKRFRYVIQVCMEKYRVCTKCLEKWPDGYQSSYNSIQWVITLFCTFITNTGTWTGSRTGIFRRGGGQIPPAPTHFSNYFLTMIF